MFRGEFPFSAYLCPSCCVPIPFSMLRIFAWYVPANNKITHGYSVPDSGLDMCALGQMFEVHASV